MEDSERNAAGSSMTTARTSQWVDLSLTWLHLQGYEISNAEVNISRSEFQRRFGDRESGYAE
jgi:hypothetical protein